MVICREKYNSSSSVASFLLNCNKSFSNLTVHINDTMDPTSIVLTDYAFARDITICQNEKYNSASILS